MPQSEDAAPILASGEAPSGKNKRREPRRPINERAGLILRTQILLDGDQQVPRRCRILEASDNGFRIALSGGPVFVAGTQFQLVHEDRWRRRVCVRWVEGNQIGVEIIGANTFVILGKTWRDAEPCTILGATSSGYRIALEQPRLLPADFLLELANLTRHRVRVRWTYGNEIALQLIEEKTSARR